MSIEGYEFLKITLPLLGMVLCGWILSWIIKKSLIKYTIISKK